MLHVGDDPFSGWGTAAPTNSVHRNPSSAYALPRTEVAALVSLSNGESIEGSVFLMPRAQRRARAETPLEMLNRPERFFALQTPSGVVLLVSKAHTLRLTVSGAQPEADPEELPLHSMVALDVALPDGSILAGQTSFDMPPSNSRPVDFLNLQPEQFFALVTPDATHCVNREHVVYARPHDEPE